MEVLEAYSHTPERLDDLPKAVEIVRRQGRMTLATAATRLRQSRAGGRWQTELSHEDVQTIIDLYRAGALAEDLAAKFSISLSSVRRLLPPQAPRTPQRLPGCHWKTRGTVAP